MQRRKIENDDVMSHNEIMQDEGHNNYIVGRIKCCVQMMLIGLYDDLFWVEPYFSQFLLVLLTTFNLESMKYFKNITQLCFHCAINIS